MTLEYNKVYNTYICSGGERVFNIGFPVFDKTSVLVTCIKQNGSKIELKYLEDYMITVSPTKNIGRVILKSDAAPGERYNLSLNLKEERLHDYNETGPFNISLLNKEIDFIVQILQQHRRDINRSLKAEIGIDFDDLMSSIFTARDEAFKSNSNAEQMFNDCSIIKQETDEMKQEATKQAENALKIAEGTAPSPLGSKLTIPACSAIPDGYEPAWYKHNITRNQYPQFFKQLVDTDLLFFIDNETFDLKIQEFGMCNAYVKIDNDTLTLPVLLNYGRGGVPEQIGQLQKDQFQGHWHEFYSPDSPSAAGYAGEQANTLGNLVPSCRNPISDGINGAPRTGNETRPKSYFELTYIKCADYSRTLAAEETTAIRNEFAKMAKYDLSNSNPAQTFIDEMLVNISPNYKKFTQISTPFITEKTGYIAVKILGNYSYIDLTIDGFTFNVGGNFANYHENQGPMYMVKKGAVISWSGNAPVFFIECNGSK